MSSGNAFGQANWTHTICAHSRHLASTIWALLTVVVIWDIRKPSNYYNQLLLELVNTFIVTYRDIHKALWMDNDVWLRKFSIRERLINNYCYTNSDKCLPQVYLSFLRFNSGAGGGGILKELCVRVQRISWGKSKKQGLTTCYVCIYFIDGCISNNNFQFCLFQLLLIVLRTSLCLYKSACWNVDYKIKSITLG